MPLTGAYPAVVELRQYTLVPKCRDELIELFEEQFIEPQLAQGISLLGLFRDARRPDRFVWMRGFNDMDSRKAALTAFYEGPHWKAHRDKANATMVDSDDVLLLRPFDTEGDVNARIRALRGPLVAATYLFRTEREAATFADRTREWTAPLNAEGGRIVAAFVTEYAQNTFPRLPVREGEDAVVLLVDGIAPERIASLSPVPPADVMELVPTARSEMQFAFAGIRGDFDFLNGYWNVVHRKLRTRLVDSDDWAEEAGMYRGYSFADGVLSIDEFDFPSTASKGCSIRTLDIAAQRWSIHWTNSVAGTLFPPVYGGFAGDRGEFYGTDLEAGTPVFARYVWLGRQTGRPRWEQAFSTDGGNTWETNWTMEFSRA